MMRELIIGSTLGTVGLACLVLGLQGYFNPEQALLESFSNAHVALSAAGVGVVLCMLEVRILLPVLKTRPCTISAGHDVRGSRFVSFIRIPGASGFHGLPSGQRQSLGVR